MAIKLTAKNSVYILTLKSDEEINKVTFEGKGAFYLNSMYIDSDINDLSIGGDVQIFIDVYSSSSFNDFNFSITTNKNTYEFEYKANKPSEKNFYDKHQTNINNDRASFMLLRTNPKLTGNIKIVINEDEELFLDTFQISKTLSDKKYRHIPVSGNSMFSNDVRNVFRDIPKSELYKVVEDNYNIFNIKKELHNQYIDTYFYGVKNNYDKLYNENFALLAPLYINNILPDFFLIFKMENAIDKDLYDKSDVDKFNYFLANGEIIKSFDIREGSELGNYLRNIQKDILQYPTSVYISMNQYNHNEWTGISIDRGVVTTATESGYLLGEVKNQVDYDRYITNGFERNGLISSRLLNLEFMFNDEKSEDYKINRYFGLYVFNHYIKDIYKESDLDLEDAKKNWYEDYPSKIVNITNDYDKNSFIRVNNKNIDVIKKRIEEKNILENILTTNVHNINLSNTKIINININDKIKIGEHFRIINEDGKEIYEIIVAKCNNEIYNIHKNKIVNYDNGFTYYRNIIMGGDEDIYITIEKQIEQLVEAFNSILPNNIKVYSHNNDISFIVENAQSKNYYFQRIIGDVLYEEEDISKEKKDVIRKNITFFNNEVETILINYNDLYLDMQFRPVHFETWNNRLTQIVKFINIPENVTVYSSKNFIKGSEKLLVSIADGTNKTYNNVVNFDLCYYSYSLGNLEEKKESFNFINFPIGKYSHLIQIETSDKTLDRIKLYNIKKNKLNIAGLLPIKDFNFAVIDNTNYIQTKGTIKKINEIDEYSIDKTYNDVSVSNIRKETSPENFYQYVNLATNDNILDKTNCTKKINKLYEEGNKKMDIPLVVPINCKWKINGKDILHNEIKSSVFSPLSYSYYLQINNSKYNIFGCEFNGEKDLSSLINKGEEQYLTIREYILNNNGNVYDIIDEKYFSKLYYNKAFNKLEVIFSGQKMEMSNNELDLSNYEGYMFSIIKSKSVNISSTNVEFIIDNDNKVIVCIWYIGGKTDSEEENNWKRTNCVSDLSHIYNKKYIPFANCDENEKDKIKDTSIFISLLGKNDKEYNYTYNFEVMDINDYALNGNKYYISIGNEKEQIKDEVDIEKCKNNSIIYIKDSSNELEINNNLKTFDNVLQNSTISFYIKGENNNFNSKNIFQINFIDPINVRETLPLKIFGDITYDEYFTYNGYIQPEIKNIFEFTKIEKDVSNTTKINFNGTNISVSKINKINQLWFNKVSDEDDYSYKEKDFAMLCIDYKKEFGLFDNCWQENFYTKYFRNRKCKSVNGYESNRSVKTFFNSQGMVVNNDRIEIEDWYNNYTVSFKDKTYFERKSNKERNNVVITLDVSKTILDKLKKESTILSNWKFNDKALLFSDDYISNIIKNVYDINLKNNISIYRSKKQKNDIDIVPYLEDSFEKIENIKNELVIVNDKYLLKIYVPNDNYDYAIKYIIYK